MKTLTAICFCLLLVLISTLTFQVSGNTTTLSPDRVFDEYGAIRWEDEKARLDNFSIQLHQDKNLIGYILVYNARRMCPGEAQARAVRAKRYVVEHRGVEWNRVIWKEAGFQENVVTVLQPVPRGMTLPLSYPFQASTVSRNDVEIIKNCRARIKRIMQSRW